MYIQITDCSGLGVITVVFIQITNYLCYGIGIITFMFIQITVSVIVELLSCSSRLMIVFVLL
jgi:hypothetical protein